MGKPSKRKPFTGFKKQVFKVQRPLYTSDPMNAQYLVYNEDRSVKFQCNMSLDIDKWFSKGDLKIYVEGEVLPNEQFIVHSRVADKVW